MSSVADPPARPPLVMGAGNLDTLAAHDRLIQAKWSEDQARVLVQLLSDIADSAKTSHLADKADVEAVISEVHRLGERLQGLVDSAATTDELKELITKADFASLRETVKGLVTPGMVKEELNPILTKLAVLELSASRVKEELSPISPKLAVLDHTASTAAKNLDDLTKEVKSLRDSIEGASGLRTSIASIQGTLGKHSWALGAMTAVGVVFGGFLLHEVQGVNQTIEQIKLQAAPGRTDKPTGTSPPGTTISGAAGTTTPNTSDTAKQASPPPVGK